MSTEFNYEEFKTSAISQLRSGGSLSGKENILLPMIKDLLESALESELDVHLEEEKASDLNIKNRKNGVTSKTMKSDQGNFELKTPRDREGNFKPQIVEKQQTFLGDVFQDRILSMYCNGMSYSDIQEHLADLYGTSISKGKLTEITDRILPTLEKWKNRPLESVYSIIWMDAIHFSVRENHRVDKKAVYVILGYNIHGEKDILGLFLGEKESSKYWLYVLENLQNRGVKDILIASIDNLPGFTQAIEAVFPQTDIQLCIIHQIRNSLKYVVTKDKKELTNDLKLIYKAPNLEVATKALEDFEKKWNSKYPLIAKSWRKNWVNLTRFFDYSQDIRRLMYTTNIVEGFNRQLRKYTKTKGVFSNDKALMKLVLAVAKQIAEKWKAKPSNWGLIKQQLIIKFENRCQVDI